MVKLLIIFWLITISCRNTYSADCWFIPFEEFSLPIFTRSYGGYHIVVAFNGTVYMDEGQDVDFHCPSKFHNPHREEENLGRIRIQCKNQAIYHGDGDGERELGSRDYFDPRLGDYKKHIERMERSIFKYTCPKNIARFFTNNNSSCAHVGYLYGYEFSFPTPINIILAEFCYDVNSFDTVYIHYVAGKRTRLLENLAELNPNGRTYNDLTPTDSLMGLSAEAIHPEFFSNGYYQTIKNYEIGELVPFKSIAAEFEKYLENEPANRIVWWSPLKNGNWEIYSQTLQKTSLQSTFEIFAGTSGDTKYPQKGSGLDNKLTYQQATKEKAVPTYIWNYIIPRKDYNNSFVVVGVNTPIFQLQSDQDKGTIFCEDMCDEIEWLKPLKRTRKMLGMGYIFCCKPADVENIFGGFPRVKYPLNVNVLSGLDHEE